MLSPVVWKASQEMPAGSSIHAFSLDGPHGYAKDFTTVKFVGTKTFTVKLVAGKYKAYCPPHESFMFKHFTVTS